MGWDLEKEEAEDFGPPSCVLVEVLPVTSAFSTLEKALEYVAENELSPDDVRITEIYFTPMGDVVREVILEEGE